MTARRTAWRGWLAAGLVCLALGDATPAWAQTEAVDYYGVDAVGSIRVVFRPDGAVIGRADYAPFGEATGATAGLLPPTQFTGQERDPEAAQDNFHARYYQPRHGRFGSVDPIFGNLFDPQQLNRYAYALNSPLVFVDPSGLCSNTSNVGVTAEKTREGMVMPTTQACSGGALPSTSKDGAVGMAIQERLGLQSGTHVPRPGRGPGDRPCATCVTYAEIEAIQEAAGELDGNALDTNAGIAIGVVVGTTAVAPGAAAVARSALASSAQAIHSQVITVAGRALMKHPELLGYPGAANQMQSQLFPRASQLNEAAAAIINGILTNGRVSITYVTKAQQWAWQFRLENGVGARWGLFNGRFIGLIGPGE